MPQPPHLRLDPRPGARAPSRAELVALLDDALAQAARGRLGDEREVVGVDLHVGFVRTAAGPLQAAGRATGGGRSVCFCEAELRDATGALVAQAMGTFRSPSPSPSPAP